AKPASYDRPVEPPLPSDGQSAGHYQASEPAFAASQLCHAHLLETGNDIRLIQALLGHEKLDMGLRHDSPASANDRAAWWAFTGSNALGDVPTALLPACTRALAPVPTPIPQEPTRSARGRPPEVLRQAREPRRRSGLRRLPCAFADDRMGGLCKRAIRW